MWHPKLLSELVFEAASCLPYHMGGRKLEGRRLCLMQLRDSWPTTVSVIGRLGLQLAWLRAKSTEGWFDGSVSLHYNLLFLKKVVFNIGGQFFLLLKFSKMFLLYYFFLNVSLCAMAL